MKKKILFAIIALVTLLAFTGCDKILEFMFPDSTGGGDGEWGNNSIQVQVQVLDDTLEWWNYDIYVELSEVTETGSVPVADAIRIGRASVPWEDPEATPTVVFRYDGLVDKTYSVRVWMDIDPVFGPNELDPSTNAHTDLGWTTFTLPYYNELGETSNEIFVFAELQAPPPPVDDSTPFVFVKGPMVVDAYSPFVNFQLDTTAQDLAIDYVQWELYDPGWNWLDSGTSYGDTLAIDFGYYFGWWGWTDGNYILRIWDASVNGETVSAWSYDTTVRVIYPAGYWDYYADVSGYAFDSWPHYLDWSVFYPIRVDFYDGYGTNYLTMTNETDYVGISNGSFYASAAWWGAMTYSYNYPDPANAGKARIYIDKDLDGSYFGAGDLAAEVQFALDQWMGDYGGYLWPTFDVSPSRFVPYNDFVRFYP